MRKGAIEENLVIGKTIWTQHDAADGIAPFEHRAQALAILMGGEGVAGCGVDGEKALG